MRIFLNHMSHEALFLFPNVVYGYMMLRNMFEAFQRLLYKDYEPYYGTVEKNIRRIQQDG